MCHARFFDIIRRIILWFDKSFFPFKLIRMWNSSNLPVLSRLGIRHHHHNKEKYRPHFYKMSNVRGISGKIQSVGSFSNDSENCLLDLNFTTYLISFFTGNPNPNGSNCVLEGIYTLLGLKRIMYRSTQSKTYFFPIPYPVKVSSHSVMWTCDTQRYCTLV